MFTGIVTDIGEISAVAPLQTGIRATIGCGYDLSKVDIGASIACSGVCLTVTNKDAATGRFDADISSETLSKTTLGDWAPGVKINLERSLRVGDELLDGEAVVAAIAARRVTISYRGVPREFDLPAFRAVAAPAASRDGYAADPTAAELDGGALPEVPEPTAAVLETEALPGQ